MKRPPGLWLLLTTVLIWLCIEEVYSVKATELIFGKTSTTTASPDAENAEEGDAESNSPNSSSSSNNSTATETTTQSNQNATKLTGIPQIDYIYDPNLPRELNGYNLSEYPFYDGLPDDIVFKCDGLHDGFYASVPHKCQVYHHCLFGTRYDFLCANYTAFDQKTFICHFVSEVDCVNSKKFWHRNDALYKAAETTTSKPAVVYTQPPAPATPVPIVPLLPRRPAGGGGRRRRPPQRRRRPEYDYYDYEDDDEFYDEPRRRKRPRYRPRPIYEDEYDDDYEEETYERRRPSGRRDDERERRPYNRRRNNDRRRYEDEDYEVEEDDRKKRPSKRPLTNKRRPTDDEDDVDFRSSDRTRKGQKRRPVLDDDYEEDVKPKEERPRPRKNQDRDRPAKKNDDVEEENNNRRKNSNQEESSRKFDRPRKGEDVATEEDKPLIKPISGSSVYSKPRTPPRIRLPVPKNEQNKYSYKTTVTVKTSTKTPLEDEEYYEDYEDEDLPKNNNKEKAQGQNNSKDAIDDTKNAAATERHSFKESRKPPSYRRGQPNRRPPNNDYFEDEVVTRRPPLDHPKRINVNSSKKRPPENEEESITITNNRERPEPVIKVLKRPFLPSRGGNPYLPRGLQPVGAKASNITESTNEDTPETQKLTETRKLEETLEQHRVKIIKTKPIEDPVDDVKPMPVVVKIPLRPKYEEFRPASTRPTETPRKEEEINATEKPKPNNAHRPINPLDIDENEYDVTLNDALNPTLPNLPVRGFPTGFSAPNEYLYQRSRYVVDPTLNQASSDYVYTIKQPVQTYSNGGNQYQSLRYTVPYQNFRPQVTHAQTQPFYSSF